MDMFVNLQRCSDCTSFQNCCPSTNGYNSVETCETNLVAPDTKDMTRDFKL